MDSAIKALGFVLLVLLIAVGFTAAISASDDTTTVTVTISEGDTETLDSIQIDMLVTSEDSFVQFMITDTGTGENVQDRVEQGETATYSFDNGDITLTVDDVRDDRGTVTIEYPNRFGFSSGANTIADNLPIILGAFALISIVAFVGVRT